MKQIFCKKCDIYKNYKDVKANLNLCPDCNADLSTIQPTDSEQVKKDKKIVNVIDPKCPYCGALQKKSSNQASKIIFFTI